MNLLEDPTVGWLVENDMGVEEVELSKSIVNEASYIGKRLTTDMGVPGRLSKEARFGEFYEDVLKADW